MPSQKLLVLVKGELGTLAVIVRTKHSLRRADGSLLRFDDGAAVIVSKEDKPVGTKVFGPAVRELKGRGFSSIVSLSNSVI